VLNYSEQFLLTVEFSSFPIVAAKFFLYRYRQFRFNFVFQSVAALNSSTYWFWLCEAGREVLRLMQVPS